MMPLPISRKGDMSALTKIILVLVVLIVLIIVFSPWKYMRSLVNITDRPEVDPILHQKAVDDLTILVNRCATATTAEDADVLCGKAKLAAEVVKEDLDPGVQAKIATWGITGTTCVEARWVSADQVDLAKGSCLI